MKAKRDETRRSPEAILWIADHRNALTEIARSCGCTTQFVSLVLYGRRRSADGKIERLLKGMGAPVK